MIGPTQPELGRLRTSDAIRRSETNRAAARSARARTEERRARFRGALASMVAALRRAPEPTPQQIRPATVERC